LIETSVQRASAGLVGSNRSITTRFSVLLSSRVSVRDVRVKA
jgi:hypothetical protein